MKQFTSLLFLLVFLASCGGEAVTPVDTPATETEIEAGINQTNEEIEAEIGLFEDNLEDESATIEDEPEKIVTNENFDPVSVTALYTNPAQDVFIDMEYTLDGEGKITSITATDTDYKKSEELPKLQENLQVLIGKSLSEVEDTYIAGGSLTIPAVKEALAKDA